MLRSLRRKRTMRRRDTDVLTAPSGGWLHSKYALKYGEGVFYSFPVTYLGSYELSRSLRSVEFPVRKTIVQEAIARVREDSHTRDPISRHVPTVCRDFLEEFDPEIAMEDVVLNISSAGFVLASEADESVLAFHRMTTVSFAIGGDYEDYDIIAYVAKTRRRRLCFVFDCGTYSNEVLATIGQAFVTASQEMEDGEEEEDEEDYILREELEDEFEDYEAHSPAPLTEQELWDVYGTSTPSTTYDSVTEHPPYRKTRNNGRSSSQSGPKSKRYSNVSSRPSSSGYSQANFRANEGGYLAPKLAPLGEYASIEDIDPVSYDIAQRKDSARGTPGYTIASKLADSDDGPEYAECDRKDSEPDYVLGENTELEPTYDAATATARRTMRGNKDRDPKEEEKNNKKKKTSGKKNKKKKNAKKTEADGFIYDNNESYLNMSEYENDSEDEENDYDVANSKPSVRQKTHPADAQKATYDVGENYLQMDDDCDYAIANTEKSGSAPRRETQFFRTEGTYDVGDNYLDMDADYDVADADKPAEPAVRRKTQFLPRSKSTTNDNVTYDAGDNYLQMDDEDTYESGHYPESEDNGAARRATKFFRNSAEAAEAMEDDYEYDEEEELYDDEGEYDENTVEGLPANMEGTERSWETILESMGVDISPLQQGSYLDGNYLEEEEEEGEDYGEEEEEEEASHVPLDPPPHPPSGNVASTARGKAKSTGSKKSGNGGDEAAKQQPECRASKGIKSPKIFRKLFGGKKKEKAAAPEKPVKNTKKQSKKRRPAPPVPVTATNAPSGNSRPAMLNPSSTARPSLLAGIKEAVAEASYADINDYDDARIKDAAYSEANELASSSGSDDSDYDGESSFDDDDDYEDDTYNNAADGTDAPKRSGRRRRGKAEPRYSQMLSIAPPALPPRGYSQQSLGLSGPPGNYEPVRSISKSELLVEKLNLKNGTISKRGDVKPRSSKGWNFIDPKKLETCSK